MHRNLSCEHALLPRTWVSLPSRANRARARIHIHRNNSPAAPYHTTYNIRCTTNTHHAQHASNTHPTLVCDNFSSDHPRLHQQYPHDVQHCAVLRHVGAHDNAVHQNDQPDDRQLQEHYQGRRPALGTSLGAGIAGSHPRSRRVCHSRFSFVRASALHAGRVTTRAQQTPMGPPTSASISRMRCKESRSQTILPTLTRIINAVACAPRPSVLCGPAQRRDRPPADRAVPDLRRQWGFGSSAISGRPIEPGREQPGGASFVCFCFCFSELAATQTRLAFGRELHSGWIL